MGICDDWLKQADIILLDAKTAGRNEIDEDSDRQYDLVS
jgi:PleD family two-component response regulator